MDGNKSPNEHKQFIDWLKNEHKKKSDLLRDENKEDEEQLLPSSKHHSPNKNAARLSKMLD